MTKSHGYIKFKKYKTYFETYGICTDGKLPLLVLHGGPGSAHNYMLPLAELADVGRQIVFYDQLGCGKSDRPDDESLWTIKTFIDELKAVRKQLGLKHIHLLGHSWGGMLAIEYLLTKPRGVQGAVLSSAMISLPLFQSEVEKLKAALPQDVYETLKKHEAAGTTDSNAYQEAYRVYGKHHLFLGEKFPAEFDIPDTLRGNASYKKMWGASEAYANGDMKNWDRVDDLHKIHIPVLVTCGKYDELNPYQARMTHKQIAGSELKIFDKSGHLPHIEQLEQFNATLRRFLDRVDSLSVK